MDLLLTVECCVQLFHSSRLVNFVAPVSSSAHVVYFLSVFVPFCGDASPVARQHLLCFLSWAAYYRAATRNNVIIAIVQVAP